MVNILKLCAESNLFHCKSRVVKITNYSQRCNDFEKPLILTLPLPNAISCYLYCQWSWFLLVIFINFVVKFSFYFKRFLNYNSDILILTFKRQRLCQLSVLNQLYLSLTIILQSGGIMLNRYDMVCSYQIQSNGIIRDLFKLFLRIGFFWHDDVILLWLDHQRDDK